MSILVDNVPSTVDIVNPTWNQAISFKCDHIYSINLIGKEKEKTKQMISFNLGLNLNSKKIRF